MRWVREIRYTICHTKGLSRFTDRRFAEAVHYLERAERLIPNGQDKALLGRSHLELGNATKAVEYLWAAYTGWKDDGARGYPSEFDDGAVRPMLRALLQALTVVGDAGRRALIARDLHAFGIHSPRPEP